MDSASAKVVGFSVSVCLIFFLGVFRLFYYNDAIGSYLDCLPINIWFMWTRLPSKCFIYLYSCFVGVNFVFHVEAILAYIIKKYYHDSQPLIMNYQYEPSIGFLVFACSLYIFSLGTSYSVLVLYDIMAEETEELVAYDYRTYGATVQQTITPFSGKCHFKSHDDGRSFDDPSPPQSKQTEQLK